MTDNDATADVSELLRRIPPAMARPLPAFDPERAPAAPGPLFASWLAEAVAAGAADPQVVTLSTVDPDGWPDARVLVLRDLDVPGCGFMFATDAGSPKGRQLASRPAAALTVYWPAAGRQVRARGEVETAPRAVAERDFAVRSAASRIAMLVGRQSEVMQSPAGYEAAEQEARALLAADPQSVAPGHTVYVLRARSVEFWQGSADRRHVRLRFDRGGSPGGWRRSLLWP